MEVKDLLYYNGFGGFTKDGKEYIIKTNEKYTPAPWSHMMANDKFGTIITSGGGGYTWSNNSRENKITTWSNDIVTDKPSEKLYIKNNDNKKINLMPYETLEGYELHYGFGYAKVNYSNDEIREELLIYVPLNESKKVTRIKLENLKEDEVSYDIVLEVEPVLGVSKEYTKKHLNINTEEKGVNIKNYYRDFYQNQIVKIISSEDVSNTVTEEKNIVLSATITLKPKEIKEVVFEIQVLEDDPIAQTSSGKIENDLEEIKNFWNEKMRKN